MTMFAAPLYFMQHNPELALFGADPALGMALDPCTHLRQMEPSERAASFAALPFGSRERAFDPEHDPINEADLSALVVSPLELERGRGATLLLPAYHLVGAVGTRGRELDLRIAEAAIAHFLREGMAEPADDAVVPVQRELFVVIAVRRELLRSPAALRRLADAHLALDAHGFWVKIEGFDERAARAEIRAGAGLLAMLGEDDRPVVSCGPGQLHPALLVNDISSSVGLSEGERFRLPAPRSRQTYRGGGRSRTAYHPKYLRAFLVGGEAAGRAFGESACRCGAHPRHRAPEGTEVELHAATVRALEAREALNGDVAERREWLLASAAMASHLGHDAGVDVPPIVVFQELFDGLDGLGEQLDLTG